MRKELMPPEFDENKVRKLSALAERLDGCRDDFDNCEEFRREFNYLAGADLQKEDFHFSGWTDAETFVRRVLTPRPQKISDISYDEMLEIITRICHFEGTEHEIDYWIDFLAIQLSNPHLSDLIYYPQQYFGDATAKSDMSPKEILDAAITNKPRVIIAPPSKI